MVRPLCVLRDVLRQYQALLEVSQSVSSQRDLAALFRKNAGRLHVVSFDSLWSVLHEPAHNRRRLHENAGEGGVPQAAADVRQVNELARAGALVESLR